MSINPNVKRISSDSDLTTYYAQQKTETNRVLVVPDPVNQRGSVVQIYRHKDDPLVGSGYRQEIQRDVFVSEYALKTGGGIYWTSYMFGPEWKEKYPLLITENPGTHYDIIIKQFHPRNIDGFTHPKLSLAVTEEGVILRKWGLADASENSVADAYTVMATWPVDSMVWHDVVFGVVWSTDSTGIYYVWLDHKLIYKEYTQTIYSGASAGCWYSEGIYSPGGYPAGLDELTIYVQGYKQGYRNGTSYYDVVGQYPPAFQIKNRSIGTRNVNNKRGIV